MKFLIAEDDFTSSLLLQGLLKPYGTADIVANGKEAVEAVRAALKARKYYDLICLDIMMPEMDGQTALKEIRDLEVASGILITDCAKVIMTTALDDKGNVMTAFREQCDAYLVKPIEKAKLVENLKKLSLIP